jgi:hypothetical protein
MKTILHDESYTTFNLLNWGNARYKSEQPKNALRTNPHRLEPFLLCLSAMLKPKIILHTEINITPLFRPLSTDIEPISDKPAKGGFV